MVPGAKNSQQQAPKVEESRKIKKSLQHPVFPKRRRGEDEDGARESEAQDSWSTAFYPGVSGTRFPRLCAGCPVRSPARVVVWPGG